MSIAERIREKVQQNPDKIALYYPKGEGYIHLTFRDLEKRASAVSCGLASLGVRKGDKVLLFVRPSLDFPVISYALFKMGAVAVLIDPGMGKKNLMKCIESVRPDALIAVGEVFVGKAIYRSVFSSVKLSVVVDSPSETGLKKGLLKFVAKFLGAHSLEEVEKLGQESQAPSEKGSSESVNLNKEELAAIVFTSGGTGRPKGVEYSQGIYTHQVDLLQNMYGLTQEDIDLPAFPLFALFTLAMGMTVVIPDMDPTKPAKACPKRLIKHITEKKVTFAGGSPAIWERVASYAAESGIKLPSLRVLTMFGAPVRSFLHERFAEILPSGDTFTPYGATECLPVSSVSGSYLMKRKFGENDTPGRGTCVGKPAPGTEIKIVKFASDEILQVNSENELGTGEIGEIIVRAPQATRRYYGLEEKTRLAKIGDSNGGFWHRMGDLGYLDSEGHLWFCGRAVHAVRLSGETLYSVNTESYFNQLPWVKRSALVQIVEKDVSLPGDLSPGDLSEDRSKEVIVKRSGETQSSTTGMPDFKGSVITRGIDRKGAKDGKDGKDGKNTGFTATRQRLAAGIVVEVKKGAELPSDALKQLKEQASRGELHEKLSEFYLCEDFPVDVRHNIKIDRAKLSSKAMQGSLPRLF